MLSNDTEKGFNSSSSYHTESEKSNILKIDIKQAEKQLETLGYSKEEPIYLRSFAAKPKEHFKHIRPRKYKRTIATLPKTQPEGTGFYFVVNGGGDKDINVSKWRALFVEWDDRSINEQMHAWQNKLPCPTMQIRTRRSVHTYWVFEEPVSVELGQKLQYDAVHFLDTDKENTNPSRVFRLAGSWHIEKTKSGCDLPPIQIKIVSCSGHRYSFEELRELIPPHLKQKATPKKQMPKKTPPPRPPQNSLTGIPPLDIFLTKRDRELYMYGDRSGSRNQSGFKFAKNLIFVANRLKELDIAFEGDPYEYFWGYCQRCEGDDWNSKEWDTIWKSANSKAPKPCMTDDAIENCLKAWQRKQKLQSQVKHLVEREPQSTVFKTVIDTPEITIVGKTPPKTEDTTPDKPPTFKRKDKIPYSKMDWVQKAFVDIFGDKPWITINDQMHEWNGKYYEPREDVDLEREIVNWLCVFEEPVFDKNGVFREMVIRKTKPENVSKILKWAKYKTGCNPKFIDPPGLNLANGILKIDFDQQQIKWELVPHDWRQYYTYCSEAIFDPNAPTEDCDKLLSALEPDQRDIFLKLIAASFDLETLRGFPKIGRIPAALCLGRGNNGKDSLRKTVSLLFGHHGLANCSFQDFRQYDKGTKFAIADLINNKRISWSPENSKFLSLDNLTSLKGAISGETMTSEEKHQKGRAFDCQAVFFFNLNELPLIQGDMEAIRSRYTILEFNKTFKKNADPSKDEIEADSRFRYNPNFIRDNVVSAFLNYVLDALRRLPEEGIDPKVTEAKFEEVRRESNHLIGFCEDMGLVESPNDRIYIKDIYERLLWWYEHENGVLTYIGERKIWEEQIRVGDRNVKSPNHLTPRLRDLFPRVTPGRDRNRYLTGICFDPDKAKISVSPFHENRCQRCQQQEESADISSDTDNEMVVDPDVVLTTNLEQIVVNAPDNDFENTVVNTTSIETTLTTPESTNKKEIREIVDNVDNDFEENQEETEQLIEQCKNYMESCTNLNEFHEVKRSDIFDRPTRLKAWECLSAEKKTQIEQWIKERNIADALNDFGNCDHLDVYKVMQQMYKPDELQAAFAKLTPEQQAEIDRIRNPQPQPTTEELVVTQAETKFEEGDRILYRPNPKEGIGTVTAVDNSGITANFAKVTADKLKPDWLAKEGDTAIWNDKYVTIVSLEGESPKVQAEDWSVAMPAKLYELRFE